MTKLVWLFISKSTWNMKSPIWLSCANPFLKHWMYSSVITMNLSFHLCIQIFFCRSSNIFLSQFKFKYFSRRTCWAASPSAPTWGCGGVGRWWRCWSRTGRAFLSVKCNSPSANIIGLDCCLNGAKNGNYARNNVWMGQDFCWGLWPLDISKWKESQICIALVHSTITVLNNVPCPIPKISLAYSSLPQVFLYFHWNNSYSFLPCLPRHHHQQNFPEVFFFLYAWNEIK